MRYKFGWQLEELERMTPYEFEIYAILLGQHLKELEERERQK